MGYWDVQISGSAVKADYNRQLETAKKRKKEIEEKYTRPNNIKNLFDLRKFNLGWKIFKDKPNLGKQITKRQLDFIKNSTDQEADIMSKLIMLNAFARDVYTTTLLSDKDEADTKKNYKNGLDNIDYTKGLNQYAKTLQELTATLMLLMLDGKFTKDTEMLADYELMLNNHYTGLLNGGIQEAKMYNYAISPKEGIAHQRISSNLSENNIIRALSNSIYATDIEQDIIAGTLKREKSMENFINELTSELLERNKLKIKNQKGYNPNDYISLMFNDASDGMFEGFDTDKNGNTIYKFKDGDDDTSDLKGLLGFNKWRKEGDFNELFYGEGGREKLEDLALTYASLKKDLGEGAAKQWLLSRLLHYASEGISGKKQFENAVLGFFEDVLGDATEIVGGIYGVGKGLLEGVGGTIAAAVNGSNLEDIWTEAMGDAFDNDLTRWGALLSSTGYYGSSWQKKANEIGFSYRDNIADPEKAENFLFHGGGSGVGYFLAETGRQSSHTMSSVWFGKLLGTWGAKGGAALTAMLGGSLKAMMKGYRIGSTLGIMASGMLEGVMDGIQVRDDIYKQGMLQVEQEIAERAIFDALNKNVDTNDTLAIAKLLAQHHVGDYETLDENGNTVTVNDLIQKDLNGNLTSTLNKRQLINLLKDSELGQLIIDDYKSNGETAAEYQEMLKAARYSAIRNGAATALIESVINGSVRSFNAGARANIKGAEREFKRRMAAIGISGSGEVSIKNVGAGFALKQSWNNMKHEAIEEGSQTITLKTFTAVGTNSIKRHIDNVYDTDTWEGFVGEWATTLLDIVVNAGAGLFDPETYEAAIQGAIGSAMGFFTLKLTGKGVKGLRPSWLGSIFNIRSTVEAENKARTELKEALLNYIGPIDTEDKARLQLQLGVENAISKNSGIRILESMTATKKALDTYNESVEKRPEDTHANKELAVDALVHSVSTLHLIRNTTFGQNMMRNLMYQANMLEEDVETSEMSEDEINKKRLEKAKEFLTTLPESEELLKKKNAALTEVLTWLKGLGKQVRTVEEIAENPTEAEALALVDIVNTAKQTIEMVDKIADIDASNSRNVLGLNFVAKNELNAKSLLLYNQELRLKHANDRLTRIGEQQSPTSNTTLSAEQKQSVAIMGNSDEKRAESRKTYEKELEETKETIKKIKESLKETKKQWAKAKTSGDELSQTLYAFTVAVLNDRLENLKLSAKITKDFLTRDKKTFWDILKNKKGTEDIIESGRVLTAYDIITLTPYERAMMLDAENKDKYSEEQQKQIDEARSLLSLNQTLDLINGTSSLHANIIANKEYINDVLTNIDAYNEHVNSAEKTFRTNVLNYRYQQGITNEVTQDEAKSFMDKLNADVKNGLISELEKLQLILKAIENEKIRNKDKAQDNTNLKRGWEIYQEILNQAYEIGNTFVNAKVTVDEAAFDELMKFLSEQNYTLKLFNDLSQQEKQSLLNNSELLNERNNNNIDAQKYVDFAAEILHLYEEAKLKGQQINKDIARGNNNKETAEERIVPKEELEEPGYLVQLDESNAELINKRSSIDGSPRFASIISSILGYIKNTNVLLDNKWGPLSKQVYDAVKKVSMTKEAITSKEDLWSKIEEEISLYDNSANVRNAWLGIKSQIDKVDVQQTSAAARTSPTVRDRSLGNNSANSSTMHTEKVSFLRNDKTKRPILEFLGKHSYAEATKYAAQLSQGSTGLGGLIYYVTDSYTTLQYRESLGDSYTDDNNLPVFTCIAVSEDFEGAFPVKYGNNTIYLVPIGVLKENTDNNNNASGINYTKSIRLLAVNQLSNSVEPTLVMANDAPLTSIPQNYKNYLMPENQNDFTGRRSITEEIKGFGDLIKSAVNSIIKKLKVGKIGDKDWNQIYYDNGSPDKTIPIAKQAGLNELVDASENSTVAEILANTLDREIDNPIIRMFYKNVLGVKNSISELILSKDHLLNLAQLNDKKAINELNEQINKRLSLSFYPANYKGVRYWEYRINVDGLLKQNPEFILEAVPIINKETDTPNQAKAITLLDFTNLFDENDEIDLKIPHANTILLQLLFEFDDEGKMHLRRRGNDEFGNVFALVQASTTVVNHANGIFTEDENKTYTEELKKLILENNHSVLSAIIEGGGLIIEGPIDNEIDYTVINKPEALNKLGELVLGASRTSLQAGVETRLNSMMGGSLLDTVEDKDKRLVVGRSDYIGIKRAKNKKNNTNEIKRHNMWVTTLAKWVSGGFKKVWGESKINKDITLTVGDNADLVFRHVLWTSEFNRSSERDTIKKIPLDYSQSGEGYYTDLELELQFGFKASLVKALAYAFTSSLNQLREERKFTFYTNVVKPQATIEVTDGSKTYTVPVAGELDMLAIGEDGRVHPIDFKTVRVSNREHLDTLRLGTVEQRTKVLKEIWQHDDFNSFEGYSRQINLYLAALSKNFSVGEGFILAVPVYYEDAKVKTKVNDNSEYGNKTLMKLDANDNEVEPYLEGLSLFEATDRTAPVKLTYIPVEFNGNFKIDMQDILAMAEGDLNFLRTNPLFADAVDAIMEANKAKEDKEGTPNKVKIDLTIPKSKQSNGGVRMEGNTAVWDDPDDEVVTENTKQTALNTNANFAEIDRLIAQLKSLSNFNENTNTVELIVGDTSYEFTVKQLEDIKKEIKELSEKEGLNAEEQYNKLTVNDLCTALNCRI